MIKIFDAVKDNRIKDVKRFIDDGGDINIKDEDGCPLLILSIPTRTIIAKMLIEAGADVNVKDKKGLNPLIWSIKGNNLDIANLLIENGAIIDNKDDSGWTALIWANRYGNHNAIKLLKNPVSPDLNSQQNQECNQSNNLEQHG